MIKVDIDAVTNIIREVAAKEILPRFRNLNKGDIAYKIADDPVTIADKEAEKSLSTRFLDLIPGSKVVGEEGYAADPGVLRAFSGESPVWIIDPIDGTRNFVKGKHQFGVIVALAERNQLVAGWLYDPTSDEVITAEKGSGAYYKGHKLAVLEPRNLKDMRGLFGDRMMEACEKSGALFHEAPIIEKGSMTGVYDHPRLIVGQTYFGETKPQVHFIASLEFCTPWDDAASVLMHHESGGYAAHWDGGAHDLSAFGRGLLLAPNKESWQVVKNWCQGFSGLVQPSARKSAV